MEDFRFKAGVDWKLETELHAGRESRYRLSLGTDLETVERREEPYLESDEQVKAWLRTHLAVDYFSQKLMRTVVDRVVDRLYATNADLPGKLAWVKFALRDRTAGFLQRETDHQTQRAFQRLFEDKKLCFWLECREGRFEIPPKVRLRTTRQLVDSHNVPVQRSLFDYVPDELNEYEKAVALYLDRRPEVLWWYRNLVGPENFSIQGYKRDRIYPDFVIQEADEEKRKPIASVLVLETKGKHLAGNEDTRYKKQVAEYYERVGKKVPWQKLAKDFKDHRFRFQVLDQGEYADRDWRVELGKVLAE